MHVEIDGKRVRLEQQHLLGAGGEGMVFLALLAGQKIAVKIYHAPTPQRQEKLLAFLTQRWQFGQHMRQKIALPLQLVRDTKRGEVIGLTMPCMDPGCEEVARLANKKHRTSFQVSTRQVVEVFLDGAETLQAIHRSGLVVGDLNDHNILYRQEAMYWIDVDAWQFATYPCPVAMEDFLAPDLYNLNLSARPAFQSEHDWYAFAVHLFRSLLLAHPYGGTHTTVPLLTQRAQQHIFALNPMVTYPKIAYTPDLLNDELLAAFDGIFARGQRGPFPIDLLRHYRDSLVECTSCHMHYPRSRRTCPLCKTTVLVAAQPLVNTSGVHATELLRLGLGGKIVFACVQGETISVLAHERGRAVLYRIQAGGRPIRRELFNAVPGMSCELMGHMLICNAPGSTQLLCIDSINGKEICRGETAIYAATRRAVFQTDETHLYSIVNNALMEGAIEDGAITGRPLRSVMERQTWFSAARATGDDLPTIFGFFQIFRQQLYWLVRGHTVNEVALAALNDDEALLDIAAYFAGPSILVRRHTQERGIDYLRSELLDLRGRVVHAASRLKRANHPYPGLHGLAYAPGMLLHPTDQGIVQEKVEQGIYKTFSATSNVVREGDTLAIYQSSLLVIGEQSITHLVM